MREVDRLMIEEFDITLLQMMENAGRDLANLALVLMGGSVAGKRILALCGKGNNGGGGMVAARNLHNWGAQVSVRLAGAVKALKPVPAHQWKSLQKLGLTSTGENWQPADLTLDAMIGYGLQGQPRFPILNWIAQANNSGTKILALDAPSGLDTTRGAVSKVCIQADATLTLAMPKAGLLTPSAKGCVGELYLGDISVPSELYLAESLGLQVTSPFDEGPIVKILLP
jgi:NAD(P)H-hydrate epimerase